MSTYPWSNTFPTSASLPNVIRTPVNPTGQGALIGDVHAVGADEDFETVLAAAFGFPFVQLGAAGHTTADMLAACDSFAAEHVKFAVAIGGLEDLTGGTVSLGEWLENWRRILATTQAAGIPILVVSMFPGNEQTDEQAAQRVAWNSELATLTAQFQHAQFFLADDLLGSARDPGPEANLWDLSEDVSTDGTALNDDGESALATALAALDFPLPVVQLAGEQRSPTIYDTPGTYTWRKPADARIVRVLLIGGGGGGGGGRRDAADTPRGGGAGGNGGAIMHYDFPAELVPATVEITVGGGGPGGAGAADLETNGEAGTDGTATSFGNLTAPGGAAGGGGNSTEATSTNLTATATGFGGLGGGLGGASNAASTGSDGASTTIAPAGGGGGGVVSSGNAAMSPGYGGKVQLDTTQVAAEDGADGADFFLPCGPGAGGAGGAGAPSGTGTDGGDGGNFGGGGGGGGGGLTAGGAGGAGAGGFCMVTVIR